MAVAFYFARRVYQETKIPIGLVACTVGGTEIECWMPPEAFRTPSLRPIEKRLDEAIAQYQATLPGAVDDMERWLAVAKQAPRTESARAQSAALPAPSQRGSQWDLGAHTVAL